MVLGDLHPAPGGYNVYEHERIGQSNEYPTAEAMSRDQNVRREELSAIEVGELRIDFSVQDLKRLLAGDTDPELVERLENDLHWALQRLYDRRDFG